jgi:hypothetical protein
MVLIGIVIGLLVCALIAFYAHLKQNTSDMAEEKASPNVSLWEGYGTFRRYSWT